MASEGIMKYIKSPVTKVAGFFVPLELECFERKVL